MAYRRRKVHERDNRMSEWEGRRVVSTLTRSGGNQQRLDTDYVQLYWLLGEPKYMCASIWMHQNILTPTTVATRSKAWNVFTRLNAGTVGSNPTQGMDVYVCVYSAFMLSCVWVAALLRADTPSKESYRLYKKLRNWRRGQGLIKGSRAIDEWMNKNILTRMKWILIISC
jgi:hypothetical protein